MVQLLLEGSADVNAEVGEYGYALSAASYNDHVELVRVLLENGAKIDAGLFVCLLLPRYPVEYLL